MNCEMCGKKIDLVNAIIEGVKMNVCVSCARFGKTIVPVRIPQKHTYIAPVKEEQIVENISEIIKTERLKRNLEQKDFAMLLNEKESLIQKIESGKYKPEIETAKKIEKILKLILVIEQKESLPSSPKKSVSGSFTLGDFIKKKN